MKKSPLFVSLVMVGICGLTMASAWADPVNADDIESLKSAAHQVEAGLKNKDKVVSCADMDHLNALAGDLILEKSAPDEATEKAFEKLNSVHASTEKFLAFCANPDSKSASVKEFSEMALSTLNQTIYPALNFLEKSRHQGTQVSWNESAKE